MAILKYTIKGWINLKIVNNRPFWLKICGLNWKQAYTNKSYEEALSKDIAKEQFAIKNGFEVLRIRLPKHSTNTIKESIDKCIKFIKK